MEDTEHCGNIPEKNKKINTVKIWIYTHTSETSFITVSPTDCSFSPFSTLNQNTVNEMIFKHMYDIAECFIKLLAEHAIYFFDITLRQGNYWGLIFFRTAFKFIFAVKSKYLSINFPCGNNIRQLHCFQWARFVFGSLLFFSCAFQTS